ncbi:M16 family metallopeptidase [Chloroflexota bacterium]
MYRKVTLDNGLRVITSVMPHTYSVSIGILIGVGSRYETDAQAGISHFIEHLCFTGTKKMSSAKEISEAIEGVGGILNGGTDKESTLYWCKVPRAHFRMALGVLADMLLNSRFDGKDVEKECRIIIDEINMSWDSPAQRVGILIDELLWPRHPLGRDIAGSADSISAISRDMIIDYLRSHYLPGSTVVTVAGNIDHDEVVTAIEQTMGGWADRQPKSGYLAYKEQTAGRLHIETKDTEQVHLCLALPGLSLFHPQRFALGLLNGILGEGMSSRLFVEIRDKLGLAYSIYSYIDHLLDSGAMAVYAGVQPKDLQVAVTAILEQLSRLKEEIPEAELVKVKEMFRGRLMLRLEDSSRVTGWLGIQELLIGRILLPEQVIDIVDAIDTAQLKQLARDLLVGDQLRLAVVGPVTGDEPLDKLLEL